MLKGAGTPLRTMSSLYLVHILYEFIFIIYIYIKKKSKPGLNFKDEKSNGGNFPLFFLLLLPMLCR